MSTCIAAEEQARLSANALALALRVPATRIGDFGRYRAAIGT
jgi:hypothetical protein